MSIFKNYKCPNGAPPDECIHIQQIINNISNYFIKKGELKGNKINNSRIEHQQSQDKPRKRTRG